MWLLGLREQVQPAAGWGLLQPQRQGCHPAASAGPGRSAHRMDSPHPSPQCPPCPQPPRGPRTAALIGLESRTRPGPQAGRRAPPPRPGPHGGRGGDGGGSRPGPGRGRAYLQALGEGAEEHQVRQAPQPPHGGRGPCTGPARLGSASAPRAGPQRPPRLLPAPRPRRSARL